MAKSNASYIRQIAYTVAVTPADDTDLPLGATRGLMVGTDGDVAVTYANGMQDTIYLLAGVVHQISVLQVNETDTTATLIKACY